MKMPCENARALVPSYLDGELSEEQAAPLRAHLFDCVACRETLKQGKVLQRWFAVARAGQPPVVVPAGFSGRVARRAMALASEELRTVELEPAGRPAATLLPFLLRLVSVAAAVLFVLALALQDQALPETGALEAQEALPWEPSEIGETSPTGAPAWPAPAAPDDLRRSADDEGAVGSEPALRPWPAGGADGSR